MEAGQAPVVVVGAGAFGTALAIAMTESGGQSLIWARPGAMFETLKRSRENQKYLPGVILPETLGFCDDLAVLPPGCIILLAVPTQSLRMVLQTYRDNLAPHILIACCKGVEHGTGYLPSEVIADVLPETGMASRLGVLTGPSFAADIARRKPTALTLACKNPQAASIQARLSQPSLRLYLTDDLIGAQLGGALKNVIAIAAGITIGAGLGESARAALMTRGFAEMARFAASKGAQPETLFGLSGFGDLVLTCSSTQSRNFRHGLNLAEGKAIDPSQTVEGVMTAQAIVGLANIADLPISQMVARLVKGECSLAEAIEALLSRPLKRENEPH